MCYNHDMNETLTIRLGQKLARALSEEARQRGLSRGEIAREAIQARLRAAGRLSVMQSHFGAVTGPPDLSTNKAYRRTWKRKGP